MTEDNYCFSSELEIWWKFLLFLQIGRIAVQGEVARNSVVECTLLGVDGQHPMGKRRHHCGMIVGYYQVDC
jgi:hypothetical protein